MTPEERFTKLEEAMLVNSSMVVRLEQHMDRLGQNLDRLEQNMDRLVQTVEHIAQTQADGFAELRASQSALFEQIDRFLRGQEGNGRKQ